MPEVFCINLKEIEDEVIEELKEFISDKRKRKADRLRRKHDYKCCVLAEAMVRSYYIEKYYVKNEDISFSRNKWGGPYILLDGVNRFSVSHAGDWVVCAYDKNEIGVDVEIVRAAPIEGIVNQFHPEEQKRLLPFDDKELFTRLWTLKESYTKYRGMGLFFPMNEFYVCERDEDSWEIPQDSRVKLKQYELEKNTILSICYESHSDVDFHMLKQEDLMKTLSIQRSEAC